MSGRQKHNARRILPQLSPESLGIPPKQGKAIFRRPLEKCSLLLNILSADKRFKPPNNAGIAGAETLIAP